MRRAFIPVLILAGLLAAPAADARVIELGATSPSPRPSCPKTSTAECQAVGRVTGFMARSGSIRNPFTIPRAGKLVAFTISLGNPTRDERRFFTDLYGGPPQVRISVLRNGTRRSNFRTHRLLRQSPLFRVDRYFGSSPTFAFDRAIRVARGNRVALTVPTWAPALAVGLDRSNWWLSSRRARQCGNVSQRAAQQFLGGLRNYGCAYSTARLTYTVTYVPDPVRTDSAR